MITPNELRKARESRVKREMDLIEKAVIVANENGNTSCNYHFSDKVSVTESCEIVFSLRKIGYSVDHFNGLSFRDSYNYACISWSAE